MKAYTRWLAKQSPAQARQILTGVSVAGVTDAQRRELFIEVYRKMWPNKIQALRSCGLSLYWLKEQAKKHIDYAADILELDLERADKLKGYSYKQCFQPANSKERMFWLSRIAADEFGDAGGVNIINLSQQITSPDGFQNLEDILKRRQQLLDRKQQLLGQSGEAQPTEPQDPPDGDDAA